MAISSFDCGSLLNSYSFICDEYENARNRLANPAIYMIRIVCFSQIKNSNPDHHAAGKGLSRSLSNDIPINILMKILLGILTDGTEGKKNQAKGRWIFWPYIRNAGNFLGVIGG